MAENENEEEAAAAAAAAKKKKMIGGVIAAGLVYRFVLSGGAEEPAPEALAAVAVEEALPADEGEILSIPEMTLNLADTETPRFARIGVAVVLELEVDPVVAGTKLPLVQDVVVRVVSGMTYDELREPGAKDALKEVISEQARAEFNTETVSMTRILFTSFVMQ